jgi:acetolactate synthase small subunit
VAGGLVVVDSDGTFKLAKVVAVFEDHFTNAQKVNKATKWVVDVVNLTAYNARRMADESLTYAKNRLEEKKKALEQVSIYEYLAKTDPEAEALLRIMKVAQGLNPDIPTISTPVTPSIEVDGLKNNI